MRRPGPVLGLFVVALSAGACAGHPPGAADPSAESARLTPVATEDCHPPADSRLPDELSAEILAGVWSLWMFADEGAARGAAAGGHLALVAWEPDEAPLIGGSPARLRGSTDIDPAAVGAVDTGDPSSESLARPGALALQWREAGDTRPNVVIRLGDRANRLDRLAFDGAYTVLRVHDVADSAFSGWWESGAGPEPLAGGRFCAVR